MKTKTILLLLAASASSCGTAPAYVKADQATYQAIAPGYRAYVLADTALPQAQKDRRLATLKSWLRRISAASPGASNPGR